MTKMKTVLLGSILALLSANVFAADMPSEIYRPAGVNTIRAEQQGNGEFEYRAELSSRKAAVRTLAKQAIAHARKQGFRLVESEIKRDDADLKFTRGNQELDISIEDKDNGRIEYQADLDLDKN